jgi:hypothetical protein
MNAIQQLANRVKSKADVTRWLSRPNNGTTDAWEHHLRESFASQFRQTDRAPPEILRDLDREQFNARKVVDTFDEYHGGAE